MRVLFTCVPGHGHLNPMVPLARSLEDLGCEVSFVTGHELAPRVRALGFACVEAGPTLEAMQADALARPEVREASESAPWIVAAAIFAGRAHRVLDDLGDQRLSPDLVIHDAMDLAGPVLAAKCGVPWVTHGLGPRWPALVEDATPAFIDETWRRHGLDPVERGGLGHRSYIEICPTAVRSDNRRSDPRTVECRPVPLEEPRVEAWASDRTGRRRIYCTLGTFSNSNVEVFRRLLEALGAVDADVLLTTGGGVDHDGLGPRPVNVRVEAYIPQAQAMQDADLVVCHGGSGTMLAALGAGLPIVAIPQGADQFVNAPWWERSGAVTVVPGSELAGLPGTIGAVLEDQDMRSAAKGLAAEIAAMPSPGTVAAALLQSA